MRNIFFCYQIIYFLRYWTLYFVLGKVIGKGISSLLYFLTALFLVITLQTILENIAISFTLLLALKFLVHFRSTNTIFAVFTNQSLVSEGRCATKLKFLQEISKLWYVSFFANVFSRCQRKFANMLSKKYQKTMTLQKKFIVYSFPLKGQYVHIKIFQKK